ncbi:hypothetical protein N24_1952 [Corynebacterium suranareeae]|uniref:Uncharacterized protein n=1 Tax=Corynebacterium suranareeae TaxID=2506452 RepID=A0A160PRG9_9CORY|nr:hypothetical protein N24_1952 [Corynebacterium suranareeae]
MTSDWEQFKADIQGEVDGGMQMILRTWLLRVAW